MAEPTRPVSIRVPISLPDKVRALTGLSFSEAATLLLSNFVRASEAKAHPPKEPAE